uniref:Uncharacterized protein n=1 Tax=Tanacetum cinerariifolium TaxID=118510 RepID=A0A6L2LUH7_TANCI|nr:hypothetical protein [Tanacetum cinerariifolium]
MDTIRAQQKALDEIEDPPLEEEILSFIRELRHTSEIKYVDYVYLLREDLVFQIENKNSKKNNDMYYPRFTKVHFAKDDSMFTIIRVISKHQDTHIYGALLPQHLTNQAMLESEAYKTYHTYATGEKTLKPKYVKKKADSDTSPKKKPVQAPKGK